LTPTEVVVALLVMKTKLFAPLAILALVVFVIGCVNTVSGRKTSAVPFLKDRIEGRYERPVEEVFAAAKEVIKFNGVLVNESTLHTTTNVVRALEGKVNQRNVWVRVEEVDPKVTAVIVQVRTKAGGRDLYLAHELEKQIALKLVR
jgi:hypothetical protein